ncbi:hypothetical protein ACWDWU_30195 [Streptomyces sp. NPDC003442]
MLIPPDFPFAAPSVRTRHSRFTGAPHVNWGRHLCLYRSTAAPPAHAAPPPRPVDQHGERARRLQRPRGGHQSPRVLAPPPHPVDAVAVYEPHRGVGVSR